MVVKDKIAIGFIAQRHFVLTALMRASSTVPTPRLSNISS